MIEISLIFKLDFFPFLIFEENGIVYFVGDKIETYSENKKLYSYKLKSSFLSACKLDKYIFVLTKDEIFKFDYKNNKTINSINVNLSGLSCSKDYVLGWKDTTFLIFDKDLNKVSNLNGKFRAINSFIVLSDTISKKVNLLSISDSETLQIRNFEGILPYFGKSDSIYELIACFSKKNSYIYFFENRNLRWYNRISLKISISDVIFNHSDRTIIILGSSQKSFYLNLKDIMGDDIWIYNPKVLGVYYLDEAFRGALLRDNKIISYGYSVREGEKRGVIKVFDYKSGELIIDHFDNQLEDVLKILEVKNKLFLVGITKRFIGFYRLNFDKRDKN
ncbi:MAG: hypothetical protein ABIL37_01990 [candidate division WOR-3 bacterium]